MKKIHMAFIYCNVCWYRTALQYVFVAEIKKQTVRHSVWRIRCDVCDHGRRRIFDCSPNLKNAVFSYPHHLKMNSRTLVTLVM